VETWVVEQKRTHERSRISPAALKSDVRFHASDHENRSHSFCSTTPERKERLFVANYFFFHALFSEALTRHQGLPRWEEMQAKRIG